MVSYGGSSWFPSEGGGGAWIPSDGGAPCIVSDGGGARNPSDGGVSHGLCGKASAMTPSYGPARHRSTPADARPRLATIPAKGPNADLFSMDHYYYPALISAMGPNADLFSMDHYYGIPYQISAKGPNADLFSMDHYYGQRQDWDDGDDDSDDPDREPTECRICNRESEHTTLDCPFMVLSRQLGVLMRTPEEEVSYYYRYMEDDNTNEWTGGCGLAFYLPPGQRSVECCAADAMMLHKDGMNLVRITGFPRDVAEPKLLYELFVKIGPLTNVIVFPDHALAFVNFVSEEAARTAIKEFTGSGFGHIMWATEKPY